MNTCEFLREANAIADQLRGKGAIFLGNVGTGKTLSLIHI